MRFAMENYQRSTFFHEYPYFDSPELRLAYDLCGHTLLYTHQ